MSVRDFYEKYWTEAGYNPRRAATSIAWLLPSHPSGSVSR